MTHVKSLSLALGGAGIVAATLIGPELSSSPAREEGGIYFDEILRANRAACVPNGASSQSLYAYYQKVAEAKTELKPFPTEGAQVSARHLDEKPPLWDNLGSVTFPVTTTDPQAQQYFDQGLRLAYAFNHAEAHRAFRAARRLDPDCALCYWGEALVLGPNINAPMEDKALAPALAALEQAQAKAGGASAKEQALIAALGKRYSEDPKSVRAALDAAYAEAMGEVAARFADDAQIAVLYAEALMDLQPWDYWAVGGVQPKGRTAEILALLEGVLAKNPDHPGAIHYYIHMVEASSKPERAEAYARRLPSAMPGAGHLVHMPFHVLYRIGKYQDALAANKAAVAADEAYLAEAAPEGLYPQAYYPTTSILSWCRRRWRGSREARSMQPISWLMSSLTRRRAAYPGCSRSRSRLTSPTHNSVRRRWCSPCRIPAMISPMSRRCGIMPAAAPLPSKGMPRRQ